MGLRARSLTCPPIVQSDCTVVCQDGICVEGVDGDGDGWIVAAGGCDDNDPDVFPGNPEICDGKDNDCNGKVDQLDVDVSIMCLPGGQNVLEMECYGVEGCRAAECVSGYYGDNCENEYSCNGIAASAPTVCSGNGACVDQNVCLCNSGWWGSECDQN